MAILFVSFDFAKNVFALHALRLHLLQSNV